MKLNTVGDQICNLEAAFLLSYLDRFIPGLNMITFSINRLAHGVFSQNFGDWEFYDHGDFGAQRKTVFLWPSFAY